MPSADAFALVIGCAGERVRYSNRKALACCGAKLRGAPAGVHG